MTPSPASRPPASPRPSPRDTDCGTLERERQQLGQQLEQVYPDYQDECTRIRHSYRKPDHHETDGARRARERDREKAIQQATTRMKARRQQLSERLRDIRDELHDRDCPGD